MEIYSERASKMNPILTKNIWAVGRNYIEHAREMKAEIPSEPLIFLKAGTCIDTDKKISLPKWSNNVQQEIEIALLLDKNLNFSHISLAIDLTARDLQNKAKTKGLPWTLSKSFISSCPIGTWVNLNEIRTLDSLSFELKINNQTTQKAHIKDMIFSPAQLLEHIKMYFPLAPYDVILTGTPEGVSTLHSGDILKASLANENHEILTCHWDVV